MFQKSLSKSTPLIRQLTRQAFQRPCVDLNRNMAMIRNMSVLRHDRNCFVKSNSMVSRSAWTGNHLLKTKRYMATFPESVIIKPASVENGLDISEMAVKQLQHIYNRDNDTDQFLRILVDSGGCHGYQNKMELTKQVDEDDIVFEKEDVKVVVDSVSLQFLRGSQVDYVQELIGSTFQVINNPNATHSCGCNISYDIDLDKIH